ncbi:hypothetical protein [Noviherbaspirillum sp.]|uniref:hypothetical protein n=1 Tax=Noviherbaspirillum sp. TaxID=1926288 RepID=UPI002FDFB09E
MTPQKLLALMENSIIKTGLLKNTSVYGRPEKLTLTEEKFFKGVDAKGKSIPIYNLKQATGSGDEFLSYICDYKRGELHYQILGREANFCFTITMNGCTFGVGAAASDGTVMVTHGNQADVKDGADVPSGDMFAKQRTLATQFHGPDVMLLEPSQYRPTNKENISTFGIWMNGAWNFFYQSYQVVGSGQMQLNGLFPFKTNMLTG